MSEALLLHFPPPKKELLELMFRCGLEDKAKNAGICA